MLCMGAGLYQIKSGTSSWKYVLSYGDDPHDTGMIQYGNSLYYSDKLKSYYSKCKKYIKFGVKKIFH
jgi:hypothetical protein